MCFGGGGGGQKQQDQSYFDNIQRDKDLAAQNQQRELENAKNARIADYNNMLQAALAKAPDLGAKYATSIGLDPNNPTIKAIIDSVVGTIGASIPKDQDSKVNPETFFAPTAFDQQFTDAQSRGRTAATGAVSRTFTPGYEDKLLSNDMVDSIINDIIGDQRNLASTSLGYQNKRGLLTPVGSAQADKALSGQEAAARSTLRGLASGVIDKDRATLRDIIGEAGTAASNWHLGDEQFNADPFVQRVNQRANDERASFGGDVRAALGNTQLFDIPSIIAQAGQAQGAQNLTTNMSPDQIAFLDKQKTTNTGRGLGSTGVF